MSDEQDWRMEISFSACSFSGLQNIAKQILKQVSEAKSFKQLPIAGGGSGGPGTGVSFDVKYTCPDEVRIAALRAEADELERGLTGQKP